MGAQELERDYKLKIKFASLNDAGQLQFDATLGEEYADLFQKQDLPDGWRMKSEEDITTRLEGPRHAWNLEHDHAELTAVEHESGIEMILVGIAVGAGGTLAAESIIGLVKWAWHSWKSSRDSRGKPSPFLIIEELVEQSEDNSLRSYKRTEVYGPTPQFEQLIHL